MRATEIFEALPLSIAREYRKDWNTNVNREVFEPFAKYAQDRNLFRLRFPLPQTSSKYPDATELTNFVNVLYTLDYLKPATTKDISHLLSKVDVISFLPEDADVEYNIDNPNLSVLQNYINGYVEAGRKKFKIGKVLQSAIKYYRAIPDEKLPTEHEKELVRSLIQAFEDALQKFQNDSLRSLNKKDKKYYVIISRHPYDIAGMSTNRNWHSCTNVIDGKEKHTVAGDIRNGSMVAYLVEEGDWNISSPIARITIYKLHGTDDLTLGQECFAAHDVYGPPSHAFRAFVNKFVKVLNRKKPEGNYTPKDGYMKNIRYKKKGHNVDVDF